MTRRLVAITDVELLPCPGCGEPDEFSVYENHIVCHCGFQMPHYNDGEMWNDVSRRAEIGRLAQDTPAASPDPIAELEAMGGLLFIDAENFRPVWFCRDEMEVIADEGDNASVSDLRAAAARLLERVRGAK